MCMKHCDCKYKVKVENVNDGFGIYGSGSHSEAISAKWSADMIIADNIEHKGKTESLRKKLIKIGCNKTSKQLYSLKHYRMQSNVILDTNAQLKEYVRAKGQSSLSKEEYNKVAATDDHLWFSYNLTYILSSYCNRYMYI